MNISVELEANPLHKRALMRVAKIGSISVADFDDVNAPNGPLLRRDLVPTMLRESDGVLFLTITASTEAKKW